MCYLEEKGFGVVDPLSLHLTHVHGLLGVLLSVVCHTTQHKTGRQWWLCCYIMLCYKKKQWMSEFIYLLLVNEIVWEMKWRGKIVPWMRETETERERRQNILRFGCCVCSNTLWMAPGERVFILSFLFSSLLFSLLFSLQLCFLCSLSLCTIWGPTFPLSLIYTIHSFLPNVSFHITLFSNLKSSHLRFYYTDTKHNRRKLSK